MIVAFLILCGFAGFLLLVDWDIRETCREQVGGGPVSWEDASIAAVDGHPAGHPASNVYDWASEERAS